MSYEHLADLGGGNLPIGIVGQSGFHGIHHLGQLGHRDRPLLASLQAPVQDFLAIELFPPSILFDDHVGDFVTSLICSEAALAAQTLAAPANDIALLALARVDDFILFVAAKGAVHVSRSSTIRFVDNSLSLRQLRPSWKAHSSPKGTMAMEPTSQSRMAMPEAASSGTP